MARRWSNVSAIHRTLKPSPDPQRGDDVQVLQRAINQRARSRGLAQVTIDGIMGPQSLKAALATGYALGVIQSALNKGAVTAWTQRAIRYPNLRTRAELDRARHRKTRPGADVCYPVGTLITDTWGYHPGVHDGVDLIVPPDEPLRAMCRARVVRADAAGWWGNNPQPSPGHPVSDGDGIIILEALVDAGPIRKGMHLCYGHAEHATVQEGQTVRAGDLIGRAGFARAWHVHFMVNDDPPSNGFYRGVGDRDPRPILDYCKGKR